MSFDAIFSELLSAACLAACAAGWVILLWKLDMNGVRLITAAILILIGKGKDVLAGDNAVIQVAAAVCVASLIPLLVAVPLILRKKREREE
jgi:ABC-type uncharacterized transport system ATPase subunit